MSLTLSLYLEDCPAALAAVISRKIIFAEVFEILGQVAVAVGTYDLFAEGVARKILFSITSGCFIQFFISQGSSIFQHFCKLLS